MGDGRLSWGARHGDDRRHGELMPINPRRELRRHSKRANQIQPIHLPAATNYRESVVDAAARKENAPIESTRSLRPRCCLRPTI